MNLEPNTVGWAGLPLARFCANGGPAHPGSRRFIPRQRGAALLLLVAVVGLGAASLFLGALSKSNRELARERRSLQALALAKDALLGFAVVNGRLPRPAASALDGRESPTKCASEAACTGFLPWLALGLEPGDAWGKLLRYSVTPEYTVAPIQSVQAVATKTVQTRDAGGQPRYLVGANACGLALQCAPAVLFSNGKNNLGANLLGAPQANASITNLDEQANDAAALHFVARPASDNPALPGGEFDDLLTWLPLPLLYQRMRNAGSLP
jgi:hypothetical protein